MVREYQVQCLYRPRRSEEICESHLVEIACEKHRWPTMYNQAQNDAQRVRRRDPSLRVGPTGAMRSDVTVWSEYLQLHARSNSRQRIAGMQRDIEPKGAGLMEAIQTPGDVVPKVCCLDRVGIDKYLADRHRVALDDGEQPPEVIFVRVRDYNSVHVVNLLLE